MGRPSLPPEVTSIISCYLTTMEHVEILLLLARDPTLRCSPVQIAAKVQTDLPKTEKILSALVDDGLLGQGDNPDEYRFAPRSPALRTAVDLLRQAYDTRPVTLVRAIYESPNASVRSFADAFRIRSTED